MHQVANVTATEALEKLKAGNELFVKGESDQGDVSHAARLYSSTHGQAPYAIVVTCSDSRIVPDAVFSAGIGDLFVIRVAGNVIDAHQLGSIEYACKHLGTQLVVAALHDDPNDDPEGFIEYILDEVKRAIGEETDPLRASELNVLYAVSRIKDVLDVTVIGAMYCLATGEVTFL